MGIFGRKFAPIIGLDISSTAAKMLELAQQGDRYKVEGYSVEALASNAVVEKNITDLEAVGDSIRRAVKRSGSKTKNVAVAVAGSAVITKVITMQGDLSDEEMASQIELEADQYIPYSLDEVNMDFEVMGPCESDPDKVDVLLAASRSEYVEDRVAAAEMAGLTAKVVDVEAYALENVFSLLAQDLPGGGVGQTIALVDIGATMTTLSVLHDAKIIYVREQVFGGKQLTEEIQRRYGLTYEEAGLAKRQGGLPDNYGPEVLEPFKESMGQQVNRSLQFFYSSSQYGQVERIILAGGCAAIEGADEVIAQKTGCEVTIANPFANMAVGSKVRAEVLANDAPSLLIACGLAMRTVEY